MVVEAIILGISLGTVCFAILNYSISKKRELDHQLEEKLTMLDPITKMKSDTKQERKSYKEISDSVKEKMSQDHDSILTQTHNVLSRIEDFLDSINLGSREDIEHYTKAYLAQNNIRFETYYLMNGRLAPLAHELIFSVKNNAQEHFVISSIIQNCYYNQFVTNALSEQGNNIFMIYAKHTGEILGDVSEAYKSFPEIFTHTNNDGKTLADYLTPENKLHLEASLLLCQKESEHVMEQIPQDDALAQMQQQEYTPTE